MNLDEYAALSEILNEIHHEREAICDRLQDNLSCIKTEEIYAKNFVKTEPDDYKVFSPRSTELLYQEQMEKIEKQKSGYEEENKALCLQKNTFDSWEERIKKILNRANSKLSDDDLAVLDIQEQDRQRIARDLHDTPLQNLAHLIHQIELSGMYIDKDPVRAKLELTIVNKKLKETIDEIRNIIFDLRPMTFDDLGLKASFERLIDSINENEKYEIELDLDDVSCETNLVLVTIYRVVQESFNNILKHSEASKIYFSCKCMNDVCHIVIRDNGKGFTEIAETGEKHFGIYGMKERIKLLGGKIVIDSVPNEGTTVLIDVPLSA